VLPKAYKGRVVKVPKGIGPAIAASLPAAAMTSILSLKWGVHLKKGETVLINRATGASGRLAVQLAALLGAGKIIGTGRNKRGLEEIKILGADAVIDLSQPEKQIKESFQKEVDQEVDIVLDFIFGKPTELFLQTL